MSIYSGFATRQQEETYDECLETVLYLLQKRVLKFYKGDPSDEDKFIGLLAKLHSQMKSMEKNKYLEPKSSRTFEQLVTFLKNKNLEEASMVAHRIAEVDELSDSQLNTKLPITHIRAVQTQQPIPKLQNRLNQQKVVQALSRPNTTATNRIRKRSSIKNHSSNSAHQQNGQAKNNKLEMLPLHNLESGTRIVKGSRNQPRQYYNSSFQDLGTKPMSKQNQLKNVEEEEGLVSNRESDVQNLIRGYMNKTKKSYMKGFNKRREEIQDMLKQI